MTAISEDVRRTFDLIVGHLGEVFSFKDLVLFTASCRGKELRFEQDSMPVAVTGCCVALEDADLIVTRKGLDEILTQAARLHEVAHLLLRHIPRSSNGPSTSTYKNFQELRGREHVVYRECSASYDDPRERDAETLATLLLDAIMRETTALPDLAREVYGSGWTKGN